MFWSNDEFPVKSRGNTYFYVMKVDFLNQLGGLIIKISWEGIYQQIKILEGCRGAIFYSSRLTMTFLRLTEVTVKLVHACKSLCTTATLTAA